MAQTRTRSSSKPADASAPSGQPTPPLGKGKGQPNAASGGETGKRRRIDWEAVERDYRTGKFTLRELEAKHGAGYAKISARAKANDWSKDLASVVRKATSAALIAEVATAKATEGQKATTDVVLAAAELNKQVILTHRSELRAARQLAMELLAEVRQAALLDEDRELLVQILAGSGATPADEAQCRQVVQKALATGSRVSSVKALAETIVKLHGGERVAFSLNDDGGDDSTTPPELSTIPPEQRQDAYLRYVSNQR